MPASTRPSWVRCLSRGARWSTVCGAPGGGLVFFAGNMVWMLATVGLLFHDTPSRLCANYLLDDQRLTGVGLLGYAVAVAAGLVLHLRRLPGFGFTFLAQERDRDGQ